MEAIDERRMKHDLLLGEVEATQLIESIFFRFIPKIIQLFQRKRPIKNILLVPEFSTGKIEGGSIRFSLVHKKSGHDK